MPEVADLWDKGLLGGRHSRLRGSMALSWMAEGGQAAGWQ